MKTWQETKQILESAGIENLPDERQWRIDLRGADLSDADLSRADLSRADLSDANLRRADLSGADLSRADLNGANLRRADLRGANLRDADLRRADLSDADLNGADLSDADLSDADLSDADLSGANLPTYQKWYVTWQTNGTVKIGCKEKTIAEWDEWFASDETFETRRNTADFERIQAAYEHAKRMYEIWLKHEAKND